MSFDLYHFSSALFFILISSYYLDLSYSKQLLYQKLYKSEKNYYSKYIPNLPILLFSATLIISLLGAVFTSNSVKLIIFGILQVFIVLLSVLNINYRISNRLLDYLALGIDILGLLMNIII